MNWGRIGTWGAVGKRSTTAAASGSRERRQQGFMWIGTHESLLFFKAQDMTETNNNNSFVPALKINAGMLNILFINSFCYYNNEYFFAFFIFKLNCFRLKYRLTVWLSQSLVTMCIRSISDDFSININISNQTPNLWPLTSDPAGVTEVEHVRRNESRTLPVQRAGTVVPAAGTHTVHTPCRSLWWPPVTHKHSGTAPTCSSCERGQPWTDNTAHRCIISTTIVNWISPDLV